MPSRKTQVTHINKCNDKIVITHSTHSTSTGPMNHSKAKTTPSIESKRAYAFAKTRGDTRQLLAIDHL